MKHLLYLFFFVCMSSFISCNSGEINSLNKKVDSLTRVNAILTKELNSYRYSPAIKTNFSLMQKYHPNAKELADAKSIYEQSLKDQEIARKKAEEAAAKAKAREEALMAPIKKIMREYNCSEEVAFDIENHRVSIGMTKNQCIGAWGRPNDINRTEGVYGVHEQWCYDNFKYLYFENGILTTIQR